MIYNSQQRGARVTDAQHVLFDRPRGLTPGVARVFRARMRHVPLLNDNFLKVKDTSAANPYYFSNVSEPEYQTLV